MRDGLIGSDEFGLSTDLYELTMAAAFFEAGLHRQTATFDVAVRSLPPERGYLLAAGLEQALAYLQQLRFGPEVIDFLASTGHFGQPFLEYLARLRFTGDVAAMAEGTAYFPPAPLARITAPVIEAQVIETYLLTTLTFQTMIASKAARIVAAAGGRPVIDFSSRRDHGPQAGLLAARAAAIGGCAGSSNVLASRHFGVPLQGTLAHSFVMFQEDELEAFRSLCRALPGNPTLLIDTYDTLRGADMAVTIDSELRHQGRHLAAVRLDSGNLVELAAAVRAILDGAGCGDVQIVASGNLDEHVIEQLLAAGAPIDVFGVGTALGTSGDAPSLNSTYKLVSRVDEHGTDVSVIKLSADKVSLPGRKQVWRTLSRDGNMAGDIITLHDEPGGGEPLLQPVMHCGAAIAPATPLAEIRDRAAAQLRALPIGVRRLRSPAPYPVTPSARLAELVRRCSTRRAGDL